MYPKITSVLADQSQGNGVKRGKNSQFPESTKTLHAHDLYLGSILFLSKGSPSPRFRSNLFMDFEINTGKLNMPDHIKHVVNILDKMLQGKSEVQRLTMDSGDVINGGDEDSEYEDSEQDASEE